MNNSLDWIISVDDHIIEPPNVWLDRASSRDRDQVPRLERIDGTDTWVYEHHRSPVPGVMACADKDPEEFDPLPVNYDTMRPGYYDPKARLADMDRDKVLAQLCFPFFPRFCGQAFLEAKDKDLAGRCVRAYNDWLLDEWCAAAPGRYIPMIIIPLWDPRGAAEEVERCAGKGAKAIAFSENPYRLGLPSIHDRDRYWDPLFSAANDAKMPLCTHIGSSSYIPPTSPDAPMAILAVTTNFNLYVPTVDWLYSGNFERFPDLKLVLSEGGIGWIPFVLERAAHVAKAYRYLGKMNFSLGESQTFDRTAPVGSFPEDPVAVFREHIFGCFIEDFFGARNLDAIGADNVMIETDYPHSDTLWPNSLATAHEALAGATDSDKFKVLQGNAIRVFNFTPAEYPSMTAV